MMNEFSFKVNRPIKKINQEILAQLSDKQKWFPLLSKKNMASKIFYKACFNANTQNIKWKIIHGGWGRSKMREEEDRQSEKYTSFGRFWNMLLFESVCKREKEKEKGEKEETEWLTDWQKDQEK